MEDDDIMKEMHNDWWLTHSSCHQLLAVLVHRGNLDIVHDPTIVANVDARKPICKKDATEMIKHRELAKELEAATTNRTKQEERMMSAKTALMKQALVSGVVEQAKEQLNLLKEFKSSFDNVSSQGDATLDYDKAVHDLLMQLPCMKKRRGESYSNT
jgi:hypothetical protein